MSRRFAAEEALKRLFNLDSNSSKDDEDDDELCADNAVANADGDNSVDIAEHDDDGDIEMYNESDRSDDEEGEDVEPPHDVGFVSANGIVYRDYPFVHRRRERNIIEPEHQARNLAHPQTSVEAFSLFFTPEIIREIQRHTNRKATDLRRIVPNVRNFMTNFLYDEIRACIGLLIRAGLDRDNMTTK